MIPGIDLNTWPFWAVAILYFLKIIYSDILKPKFDKRLAMQLETEKKNLEIKKYNEDAVRWEKMSGYLEKQVFGLISFPQAQIIYTSFFRDAQRELFLKVIDFLEKNKINDPDRQVIIRQHLIAFLENQKNRLSRALDDLRVHDIPLNSYVKNSTKQHTLDFVDQVTAKLFSSNDVFTKKTDLDTIISAHYNEHINEAIDLIRQK